MPTPFSTVFGAFLARIEEDEWLLEEDDSVVEQDMAELLKMAIFDFRFPRVSLAHSNDLFTDTLTNNEIQILAISMKLQWLRRQVNTWRNIKQQYSTKDFQFSSQANHLDKLLKSQEMAEKELRRAYDTYDRSRDGKPFPYRTLAGGDQL